MHKFLQNKMEYLMILPFKEIKNKCAFLSADYGSRYKFVIGVSNMSLNIVQIDGYDLLLSIESDDSNK